MALGSADSPEIGKLTPPQLTGSGGDIIESVSRKDASPRGRPSSDEVRPQRTSQGSPSSPSGRIMSSSSPRDGRSGSGRTAGISPRDGDSPARTRADRKFSGSKSLPRPRGDDPDSERPPSPKRLTEGLYSPKGRSESHAVPQLPPSPRISFSLTLDAPSQQPIIKDVSPRNRSQSSGHRKGVIISDPNLKKELEKAKPVSPTTSLSVSPTMELRRDHDEEFSNSSSSKLSNSGDHPLPSSSSIGFSRGNKELLSSDMPTAIQTVLTSPPGNSVLRNCLHYFFFISFSFWKI